MDVRSVEYIGENGSIRFTVGSLLASGRFPCMTVSELVIDGVITATIERLSRCK